MSGWNGHIPQEMEFLTQNNFVFSKCYEYWYPGPTWVLTRINPREISKVYPSSRTESEALICPIVSTRNSIHFAGCMAEAGGALFGRGKSKIVKQY